MYIVRWLLGHPIIATWVALSVVAILLIFGSGDKETTVTDGTPIAVSSSDVLEAAVSNTEEKASANTAVKQQEVANVVSRGEEEKIEVDLNTSVAIKPVITPLKSESDDLDVSVTSGEIKSAVITDLSQMTSEEMLLMAREAYWNNGLDEAALIYNKLIEKGPEVLEYKGELGNVYWRQGYPKKAATLYSEIAIPMIENGGTERVANMIGFIGLFYPDRATMIHEKMQSNK